MENICGLASQCIDEAVMTNRVISMTAAILPFSFLKILNSR